MEGRDSGREGGESLCLSPRQGMWHTSFLEVPLVLSIAATNLDKGFRLQLPHSYRTECMGGGIWKGFASGFCLSFSLTSSVRPLECVWCFL